MNENNYNEIEGIGDSPLNKFKGSGPRSRRINGDPECQCVATIAGKPIHREHTLSLLDCLEGAACNAMHTARSAQLRLAMPGIADTTNAYCTA